MGNDTYKKDDLLWVVGRNTLEASGIQEKDEYLPGDVIAIANEVGLNPPTVMDSLDCIIAEREIAESEAAESEAQKEAKASAETERRAEEDKKRKRAETWKAVGNAVTYVPRKIGKGFSAIGNGIRDFYKNYEEEIWTVGIIGVGAIAVAGVVSLIDSAYDYPKKARGIYRIEYLTDSEREARLRGILGEAIHHYDDHRDEPADVVNAANSLYDALHAGDYKVDKGIEILGLIDDSSRYESSPQGLVNPTVRYINALTEKKQGIDAGFSYLKSADSITTGYSQADSLVEAAIGIMSGKKIEVKESNAEELSAEEREATLEVENTENGN